MAENKMAEVAKLLGVELEEEFHILDEREQDTGYDYKITKSGLLFWSEKLEIWIDSVLLEALLKGLKTIRKLPYKPKIGDEYWTIEDDEETQIAWYIWNEFMYDYMRLKSGNVFRTETEAIEARPRIYKELTGREWTE